VSYLKKVKFNVIDRVPVNDVYGYIETLTSVPVKDADGDLIEFVCGVYDIDGNAMTITPDTTWIVLSFSAHVWNDGDFENAIAVLRECTEFSSVREKAT